MFVSLRASSCLWRDSVISRVKLIMASGVSDVSILLLAFDPRKSIYLDNLKDSSIT